jgi:hypothetical protein
MTSVTVSSPTFQFNMNLKVIGKLGDYDTLIVTRISQKDDVVSDTVLNQVKFSQDKKGKLYFISESKSENLGLFTLVTFLHPECSSLYEVFTHYDGNILAFNDENILKADRKSLEQSFSDVYIITAY